MLAAITGILASRNAGGLAPVANFVAIQDFVTNFGQDVNPITSTVPMTFYPEAAIARDDFMILAFPGGGTASWYNFEAAPLGTIPVGGLPIGSIAGVGVTLNGSASVVSNLVGQTNLGRYSVSGNSASSGSPAQGTRYLEAVAPTSGVSSFVLEFDRAVSNFGFFATDVGDRGGLLTLELTLAGGGTELIEPGGFSPDGAPLPPDRASGSVLFFGVRATNTNDYFTAVRFISAGGTEPDGFGFDMFTTTAAPPGPAPLPPQTEFIETLAGRKIYFYDTSTNTPTSWLWNFGDGTTSTLQNPTKTYTSAGFYTVSLTATNASGSNIRTRTSFAFIT